MTCTPVPGTCGEQTELGAEAQQALAALREVRAQLTALRALEDENEARLVRAMGGARVGVVNGDVVVYVESRWDTPLEATEPDFYSELVHEFRTCADYAVVRLVGP